MDTTTVIAIGVGLHLLGSLLRHFVHEPKKQAQINAIEGKVEDLIGQLAQKGGGS